MSRRDGAGPGNSAHDVAVVGAGIVGCAAARELASAGYDVVLIDRGDFGAGTSSRSSRNLYCGLSYLKPDYPLWQMPFRLMDVASRLRLCWIVMRCRAEMVREMPERLEKLPYYFPYRRDQKYPAWLIDLGFRILTAFSDGISLAYRRIPAAEAKRKSGLVAQLASGLHSVGYLEEYQYRWAERICVETALEAERYGAVLRTYTAVEDIARDGDGWTLTVEDRTPEKRGAFQIRAKVVVNAAGPWIDRLVPSMQALERHVAPLKGVNLLVKLPEAYRGQGLQTFSTKAEGLGLYFMPWGDHHFIGPTETMVTDDPDTVRVTPEEIDYLLREANAIFPDLKLTPNDVIHGWCGVRPWSTDANGKPFAPVRVRERKEMPGVFSVTGATIMVNRHAARLVRKAIARRIRPSRPSLPYGSMRRRGRRFESLEISEDLVSEIVQTEHVVSLGDLVRRRLPHGWEPDLGWSVLETLSRYAARALAWTEERRMAECQTYRDECVELFMPVVNKRPERNELNGLSRIAR
ncbi:FAD-dependent oxidoreductase [Mesorhizobium silamurunense]|uniref:FAD-dependent oxidoreductase n=1 Tax=Mesorhizobium silamurunense TaxID=499528 RepID=UPI00177AF739|nr:FAD-dependent oxidoreductase [Mesorhizobium silamurunense]